MNAEQRQRASQLVRSRTEEEAIGEAFALLHELIEQPTSVPDWLETTRFLTDVTTAAGLLEHGRRDKGLAQRIGDFAHKYRMLAAAPAAPGRDPELARDAELLGKIKHSIAQARVPGNDWRRELALIDKTIDAAIAAEKDGAA